MTRLKVNTLRRRTEEMTGVADNFSEIYKFGAELEDIGNLIKRMAFHMHNLQDKVDTQAEELRRQASVDAVEVVRCKDCKHRGTDGCAMWYECMECKGQHSWENCDDFCSYGEKMDGDQND